MLSVALLLQHAQATAAPAVSALRAVCDIIRGAATAGKPQQLLQLFTHEDPLVICVSICLFWVAACWVWSLVTDNYSHVDRLWSILPVCYLAVFAREELHDVILALYAQVLQLAQRRGRYLSASGLMKEVIRRSRHVCGGRPPGLAAVRTHPRQGQH